MFEIIKHKANSVRTKHWDINATWNLGCTYNLIFGQRGNGKTYGWKQKAIELFAKNGTETALIRRNLEDFKSNRASGLFDDIVANGVVAKYTKNKYDRVVYKSRQWFFAKWDEKEKKMIKAERPFCHAFSLSAWEHDKSSSYPYIDFIVFEEFITKDVIDDYEEYWTFKQTVSTIVRDRVPSKIYLIGNTVNTDSGYFENMNVSNVHNMKIGEIDRYTFTNKDGQVIKIACEWTEPTETQDSKILFDFDNDVRSNMMTEGAWQIPDYPHLDIEYDRRDVLFTYYIIWRNTTIQCDIIFKNDMYFTFIHKKKVPLTQKQIYNEVIYSRDYSIRPNHFRYINQPRSNLQSKIWSFFDNDRVLYSTNKIGDMVDNYIKWCRANSRF